jgi:hypothetical protein
MFDVFLALDRVHEKWKLLIVDKPPQAISARKAFHDSFAMFISPSANVRGHACVKDTSRTVCHDVADSRRHDILDAKKMTASSAVMMTEGVFKPFA